MEVIKLLEQLKEEIERPRQFLGITFGLKKEECALLIRRVQNSLPAEIKDAERVTRDAEKIMGSAQEDARVLSEKTKAECTRMLDAAKKEADRMSEQAGIERERMLSEHEVLKAAKSEADRTRGEADLDATRTRRSADDYALDVLTKLDNNLAKAQSAIERGKSELQRPTKPVGPAVHR